MRTFLNVIAWVMIGAGAADRTLSHRGANMPGRKLFHFGGEKKCIQKPRLTFSLTGDGPIKV